MSTFTRMFRRGSAVTLLCVSVACVAYGQNVVPRVIERSQLGKADAVEVVLPVGRIVVIGQDIQEIRYTVQRLPQNGLSIDSFRTLAVRTGDSLARYSLKVRNAGWDAPFFPDTTALRNLPAYQGPYQSAISENGLTLQFPPPNTWNADSLTLYINGQVGRYLNGRLNYVYADSANVKDARTFLSFFDGIINGTPTPPNEPNQGMEVRIFVPKNLALLKLQILGAGTIAVQDFDGELVVTSAKGPVYLGHIGGSALVEANDGNITATVSRVVKGKPISLMSASGRVGLWVPFGTKSEFEATLSGGKFLADGTSFPAAPPGTTQVRQALLGANIANLAEPGTIKLRTLAGDIYLEQVKGDLPRWPKPPN